MWNLSEAATEILKQFPSWWMDVPWTTSKASCSEIPADSSQPPVLISYARQYVRHTKRPNKPILLKGKGPWKTRLFACSQEISPELSVKYKLCMDTQLAYRENLLYVKTSICRKTLAYLSRYS